MAVLAGVLLLVGAGGLALTFGRHGPKPRGVVVASPGGTTTPGAAPRSGAPSVVVPAPEPQPALGENAALTEDAERAGDAPPAEPSEPMEDAPPPENGERAGDTTLAESPAPVAEPEPAPEPMALPDVVPAPEADEAESGEQESTAPAAPATDDDAASPRDRARELVSQANYLRRQGRHAEARPLYERALRLAPGYGRALAGLAKSAIEQRRASEALRYANQLVRSSRSAGNYVLLGDAQRLAGNRAAAEEAWAEALRMNPRHPGARRRLR
ncbi:MAG: tetratricopeptide repeat protein, partial [Myxococcota bacterium]